MNDNFSNPFHEDSDTGADAELEQNPGYASDGSQKVEAFNSPVSIRFTHYRNRLIDIDNYCVKAVIDGLVHGGVLADDTPEQVAEVTHCQVKIGKGEKERTEVWIQTLTTVLPES